MQQRSLGPDAPPVSCLGFGAMPLSREGRPPEADAVAVIHAALDAGVTLIDTADVYCEDDDDLGRNERLVGRAVREWSGDRARLVIATKGGFTRPGGQWVANGRPEHLRAACERSLAALGTECIDLYQLHAPDSRVPFPESVGALARLQEEGKVRWIGVSNVSVGQIRQAEKVARVVTVQNRLNPYFREAVRRGVVAYCAERGIGFLAYSPVGGGRLNKELPTHPALAPLTARHGASAHAVVLAWVLAQAPNVIPIPAARTVPHALDSAGAAAVALSPDDLAAIDRARFDPGYTLGQRVRSALGRLARRLGVRR